MTPVTLHGPFYLADQDADAAQLPFTPPARTKKQRRQMLEYWLANDLADSDLTMITRTDEPDFKGYEYFERV